MENSHHYHCTFQKHVNSEVQNPTDVCVFRCRQSSKRTLRNRKFTSTGSKGHGFLLVDFDVLCFLVSRFIACDLNYD